MSDEMQKENGFCPKCGALMRNGVCPCCGYGKEEQSTGPDSDVRNYQRYQQNMNNPGGYYQNGTEQNQNGYYQNGAEQNQNNGYYQNGYYQNGADQNNGYYQNGADQNNGYYQNGANQNNGYYQNGAGQDTYYQGTYTGVNTDSIYAQNQNRGKAGIIVGVICGILGLLLMISMIGIVYFAIKTDTTDSDYSYDSDYDDYDYDDYNYDDDYDSDYDYDDSYSFTDSIDWEDESWKEEPYNYDADSVGDEYYVTYCNCIDETVSYSLKREYLEEVDEENQICIRVSYYQLEGDLPEIDSMNEAIKEKACMYANLYLEDQDYYEDYFEDYGPGFVATVDSYVTYNDEHTISFVMDSLYEDAIDLYSGLNCLTLNLDTATEVDNSEVLNIDDDLVAAFRKQSNYQNGTIDEIDEMSDDEIKENMENSLILFYTPLGLEVGFEYSTDYSYGWVTATFSDYEKYLKSL